MRKGCVCADKPTQIPTSTFITLCEWVGDPFRSRAACLDLLLWGRSLLCIENEDRNGDRRSQWRTKIAMETEDRNGDRRSQWKPRIDRNRERRLGTLDLKSLMWGVQRIVCLFCSLRSNIYMFNNRNTPRYLVMLEMPLSTTPTMAKSVSETIKTISRGPHWNRGWVKRNPEGVRRSGTTDQNAKRGSRVFWNFAERVSTVLKTISREPEGSNGSWR